MAPSAVLFPADFRKIGGEAVRLLGISRESKLGTPGYFLEGSRVDA